MIKEVMAMKSSHRVFPLNKVHEVTVKKSPTAEQNIMFDSYSSIAGTSIRRIQFSFLIEFTK
jgi:hypothetical protein